MSDLAVIGLACRLPGAAGPEEFADLLRSGRDAVTRGEGTAAGRSGYVAASGQIGRPFDFDPALYGMSEREALLTDPQHRLFLDTARRALEDAGVVDTPDRRVGVYAGVGRNRHERLLEANGIDAETDGALVEIGNEKDHLASRVSFRLGLRGPGVVVQSACSTGLLAVHVAGQALREHDCDVAVVGAAAVRVPLELGYDHRGGGIGSASGRCRPFSSSADGTVSGDGVGAVVLCRLADALDGGLPVHAVIRGSAVNNDGAKDGYGSVSATAQEDLILTALAVAGVGAADIGYVEAHGSATPLGDAVEWQALQAVFSPSTHVGSTKSNLGHLREAAGIAGLIKAVQVVRDGVVPPSLHDGRPAAFVTDGGPTLADSCRDWAAGPGASPRLAMVNSFGLGGTNVSVVLEQPPPLSSVEAVPAGPQLLSVSAHTAAALSTTAAEVADVLDAPGVDLAAVARTLQAGRCARAFRRAVVGDTPTVVAAALRDRASRDARPRPRVGLVFSGIGDQYVGMTQGLCAAFPAFNSHLADALGLASAHTGTDLRALLFPPGLTAGPPGPAGPAVDLRAMLRRGSDRPRFPDAVSAHAALFCVQEALAATLVDAGVVPVALFGHSLGELTAATLAGVFARDDAHRIVVERARLLDTLPTSTMLAVGAAPEALPELPPGVHVATWTSPVSCVVAGRLEEVAAFATLLGGLGLPAQVITGSAAFHTPLMEPVAARVEALVAAVPRSPATLPLVRDLDAAWDDGALVEPAYWARQLTTTVHHGAGVARLAERCDVLVEVGPGQMRTVARQLPSARDVEVATTVRRSFENADDRAVLLGGLATLWENGADIAWSGVLPSAPRVARLPATHAEDRPLIVSVAPLRQMPSATLPAAAAGSLSAAPAASAAAVDRTTAGVGWRPAVARAWEVVLGVVNPQPRDHFFDLGGDSLMGVRLIALVSAAVGREVPPSTLFHEATLEGMARSVDDWLADPVAFAAALAGPARP